MKITFLWRCRLAKLLTASAALVVFVLVVHTLFNRSTTLTLLPSPLPLETYQIISPATYRYVLNQPALCRDRSPFLVLMVPVAPSDRTSRDAIRKTWGVPGLVPGVDSLTLFYLGLPEEEEGTLAKESREHGDIVQMDFVDSYHNLTIKTMMIMNWIATYCPNASYAMKVDADNFVNVYYLTDMLRGAPGEDYITGSVIRDGRPRRGSGCKWCLSEDVYPDDSFPAYVSGAGYVFSTNVAKKISLASRHVSVIPLEDVYVGLCLRVAGVSPVYSRTFFFRNLFQVRRVEYDRCTFAKRVIVNGFEPPQLLRIWRDFSRGHLRC